MKWPSSGWAAPSSEELWNKTAEQLTWKPFKEAIADAGIEKKDIDAAWFATIFDAENVGKSAVRLATTLKLPYIPVTRIENFCASGTEAFRAACYAVNLRGRPTLPWPLGCEKLKDTGYGGLPDFGTLLERNNRIMLPNFTAPGDLPRRQRPTLQNTDLRRRRENVLWRTFPQRVTTTGP